MIQEIRGKKVHFNIIYKDSKGRLHECPQTGRILSKNKTGTGFVIRGISIPGLYNRLNSDIIFEKQQELFPVEIIDCTDQPMAVAT
ncbi:MAG: hypothetical protein PHP06_05875 [Clostridia bacterium]|nr:hypothetical protein [Clostridia bacterium]